MDKDDGLTVVYCLPPCPMFVVLQGRWLDPKHICTASSKTGIPLQYSNLYHQIHEICQRATLLVTNIYKG